MTQTEELKGGDLVEDNPESGLCVEAQYRRTIDGDTIEFAVVRSFHIRLRDIDIYEIKEPKGIKAGKFVHDLLHQAKNVSVFVPSNNAERLMDINSFNRLVGDVYVDGRNLADILREEGYEKR